MQTLKTHADWWNVDRDAKRVGAVMLIALFLGALFLTFSIQTSVDARDAARSAGLLWGAACCAIGGLLGFIFGIPRSLSSDTARTALPTQNAAAEEVKTQAAASMKAAEIAIVEKDRASAAADIAVTAVATLSDEAKQRQAEATGTPTDANAVQRATLANQKLEEAHETQKTAEEVLTQKIKLAQSATEAAKKDADALTVLSQSNSYQASQIEGPRGPSTTVNTNLEQISDWLTKIIVGVSLVNSEKIGSVMLDAAGKMSQSLGGRDQSSLSLAIMIYFSIVGFLGGYLLTRLFLQRAFNSVEYTKQVGD